MIESFSKSLTLPCGAILRNRLAKAAMTDGLADEKNRATGRHVALYRRWAAGGMGLMITGNVQVDRRYLERSGNIAIDGNGGLEEFRKMAAAATSTGAHCWVQINHPGRQAAIGAEQFVAPSALALPFPGSPAPRELTEAEILDVIRRFAHVAKVSRDCGFTGVQVHSAHGYLLSEFLNPRSNQRRDSWGGSLENRARLLLEVIKATRRAVGADFPVSVKLNSADFQRGGMTEGESIRVATWLGEHSLDLLEVSGGNYESQEMIGFSNGDAPKRTTKESTLLREAYFLDYAEKVRPATPMPLMITGGFRSAAVMDKALKSGALDVIGLARPHGAAPDLCWRLIAGTAAMAPALENDVVMNRAPFGAISDEEFQAMQVASSIAYFYNQIRRFGDGLDAETHIDWNETLARHEKLEEQSNETYRQALAASRS
jgi:2,4-dienoyl-CoA reductase-like NADH-dependent reductase (Old Yellow Enzyme family)